MSIKRASGAIPTITALHIATASLAVPKSVINTIVGRAAATACLAPAVSVGVLPHAQQKAATAKISTAKYRMREAIESPKPSELLLISREPCRSLIIGNQNASTGRITLHGRIKAMAISPSPECDAVYRMPEIFVSRFRLQVRASSRLIISLGFSRASFTISRLRKRSYARPSSLPRPVKAQPHCVRELNQ